MCISIKRLVPRSPIQNSQSPAVGDRKVVYQLESNQENIPPWVSQTGNLIQRVGYEGIRLEEQRGRGDTQWQKKKKKGMMALLPEISCSHHQTAAHRLHLLLPLTRAAHTGLILSVCSQSNCWSVLARGRKLLSLLPSHFPSVSYCHNLTAGKDVIYRFWAPQEYCVQRGKECRKINSPSYKGYEYTF